MLLKTKVELAREKKKKILKRVVLYLAVLSSDSCIEMIERDPPVRRRSPTTAIHYSR